MSVDQLHEQSLSRWYPPESVYLHYGDPIPQDADFFIGPPEEIGQIISAETTLKTSKTPRSLLTRIIISLAISASVYCVLMYVLKMDFGYWAYVPPIASFALFFVSMYCTLFMHTCTYIGEKGIAEYTCSGSRNAKPKEMVLEFENCHDVTISLIDSYHNGVYSATTFEYTWRDVNKKTLLTLGDAFCSKEHNPRPSDTYWHAVAAERQWNAFAYQKMMKELENQGYVDFQVRDRELVRVGDGYLEFHFGGNITKLTWEDIKTIKVKHGEFTVHTHEARWFSSKGKFSFECDGMGNLNLFVYLSERLAGFAFV